MRSGRGSHEPLVAFAQPQSSPGPEGISHPNIRPYLPTHRLTDSPTPSRPPRLGGGVADDDGFEEFDGAGEAFVDAHQRVFMLDGDGAVVAGETQLTDQGAPELLAVPEANRAEDPRAVDLVGVWLCVEHTVDGDIRSV